MFSISSHCFDRARRRGRSQHSRPSVRADGHRCQLLPLLCCVAILRLLFLLPSWVFQPFHAIRRSSVYVCLCVCVYECVCVFM